MSLMQRQEQFPSTLHTSDASDSWIWKERSPTEVNEIKELKYKHLISFINHKTLNASKIYYYYYLIELQIGFYSVAVVLQ
jgi:competence transcription factor ComK